MSARRLNQFQIPVVVVSAAAAAAAAAFVASLSSSRSLKRSRAKYYRDSY